MNNISRKKVAHKEDPMSSKSQPSDENLPKEAEREGSWGRLLAACSHGFGGLCVGG